METHIRTTGCRLP